MTCAACGSGNREERRFCARCGAPLVLSCPACGFVNEPNEGFCGGCGTALAAAPLVAPSFPEPQAYTPPHLAERILTSRSALEGERKLVTVLFVDVSGFTSLAERLDPEDVHALMARAFELMLAEVHRYEGTVNQFLGDGIMALFGAPLAHEDHARRAVLAALGIRGALRAFHDELERARRIRFQVRLGLHTGLVVVGSIGSDLRMDYTAVGDTTNVAARLLQAAAPGQALISDAVQRLVAGHVEAVSLGHLAVKGRTEPVTAFELTTVRTGRDRLEIEAERGLTPLVARHRELDTLAECFERAGTGQGQVVFVTGEPGIGKSRLLREFRQRVSGQATWLEGHCLSFGRAIALHPVIELVRRRFGIEDGDADGVIVEKIERAVRELGEDMASVAPYLRALLSVDPGDPAVVRLTPQTRRVETFEALRRLLIHAAQTQPQVIVVEDLHWVDPATEAFLSFVADSVATSRLLLVLTYRPGYAHALGERSYHTRLALRALSPDDSARMGRSVLGAEGLAPEIEALLARKAEGNPFFVEELAKSLHEAGALHRTGDGYVLARRPAELAVPETVQDVIMARIDRLAEAPKRALQLASVVGREFTRRLLERLAEAQDRVPEQLRELTALELILERSLFPELLYMFKHALTQDVAYGSLLIQRRRELHRLVGHAIEELYAERLAEHYEVLAHHFSRAEVWDRALDYLLRAAEKAVGAYGLREALALYDEALAAVRRLGERVPVTTRMAIHRARSDLFFGIGEFERARAEAAALRDLARGANDRPTEAVALVQMASANQWKEAFPEALEQTREAIAIAEGTEAEGARAGALYVRGYVHALSGNLETAEADLDPSLAIARATGDAGRQGLVLHLLGLLRTWQGQYREGLALSEQGVAMARRHRLVIPLIRCLWTQGVAWNDLGQYDAAHAAFSEALTLSEQIGDDALVPRLLNTLGWLHIDCGDFDPGIELSERSYAVTARSSRAGHATGAERRAFIRNNEADAFLAMGDLPRAADALDETFHVVRHPPPSRWMTWRYTTHCYATMGQLALARGDLDQARRFADQSLETAVPTRSRKYESWAWRLKGESALGRRAWDDADVALRRALAIAESIAQPRHAWQSLAALGRLHAARGRRDEARSCQRAARDLLVGLAATVQHPGLRAGLESTPAARELSALAGSG
jgi:class 3 adenylate cyclase/tetratricopeptide (TPR) repeat protein